MTELQPPPRRRAPLNPLVWALIAEAVLLLVNVQSQNFWSVSIRHDPQLGDRFFGTLFDILRNAAPIALMALGMTLVIATYGIDLSVGAIVAIAGTLAAQLVVKTSYPFSLVLPLALGVGLLCGLWNGVLVAYVGVQPIVATLILMVAGRGIAMLISKGQQVPIYSAPYIFMDNGALLYLPFSYFIVALAFAVTWFMTRRTSLGMLVEAVGNNETASYFCGINARLVKLLAYGLCGLTAGLAGIMLASDPRVADPSRIGRYTELDAIFAVVVGGTALSGGRFSLVGSIIGAILLCTLQQTMWAKGVNPSIAPVPKSIVIIGVCLLQSGAFRRWVAVTLLRRRPA